MAEALVSLLVEQLGSVVYHQTGEGVKLVLNGKKDIDKFSSTLKLIQNVLHDAEKKQVSDSGVRDWLDQLKDVSYKMNDVVDAWNTDMGNEKLRNKKQWYVSRSIRCNCICLARLDEVTSCYKIGSAIKDLNEELTGIYIDKNKYSFQCTIPAAASKLNC